MSKPKRFIAVADSHGNLIDPESERAVFEFIKDFKPEVRIHLGDGFDFKCLRRGASDEEKQASLQDDWDMGSDFIRRFFDGAKTAHYLIGNHSFSDETEVLTDSGWKNIKEITMASKVAEFDVDTRAIFFSNPLGLVSHHEDSIYEIEGRYTKQAVSSKHDVVLWGKKVKAEQLLGQTINEKAIAVSGSCLSTSEPINELRLRLLTWVIMDGCIVDLKRYDPKTTKARIQFKLSEPKKIDRLRWVLEATGTKYTFAKCKKTGINKLQPFYFRIYGDAARSICSDLGGVKLIPWAWASLPASNLAAFIEELSVTDGSVSEDHRAISWCSVESQNVDVVQAWAVRNGWDVRITGHINQSGFPNGKAQNLVSIIRNSTATYSSNLRIEKVPYGRRVFCLTMPAGTVVTRLHGKVAFTGNCTRLWRLEDSTQGVIRDYARDGIKRFDALMKRSRAHVLPYDARLGVLRIGHLKFIHGYATGLTAGSKHARAYGSVAYGHTHTIEVAAVDTDDGPREARGIGALCQIDMPYNAHQLNKLRHSNGFAYGYLFDDGDYQIFQARKINGKFYAAHEIKTY